MQGVNGYYNSYIGFPASPADQVLNEWTESLRALRELPWKEGSRWGSKWAADDGKRRLFCIYEGKCRNRCYYIKGFRFIVVFLQHRVRKILNVLPSNLVTLEHKCVLSESVLEHLLLGINFQEGLTYYASWRYKSRTFSMEKRD